MAFAVTYDASNGLASGSTAQAGHINQNFTDIETELTGFPNDGSLGTGVVGATQLATNSVTTAKIKDSTGTTDGVTTAKIADDAVDADKLAADAVVDDSIDTSGAFSLFGAKVTTDSTPATLVKTEVYKVETDGFVEVNYTSSTDTIILGYTGTASTPTVVVHRISTINMYPPNNASFCMVVPKNNYWTITATAGTPTIYWTPIGTGGCVKQ